MSYVDQHQEDGKFALLHIVQKVLRFEPIYGCLNLVFPGRPSLQLDSNVDSGQFPGFGWFDEVINVEVWFVLPDDPSRGGK